MKKAIYAAVAATIAAGSAVAHPGPEAHICGVDPASVSEWPGYGTRDNIYDRGDYFFAVEVENFSPSISYKHWNKVEAITNHIRIYKDDCRVSNIEIVHPESKDEVEEAVASDRWSLVLEAESPGWYRLVLTNTRGFSHEVGGNIQYSTEQNSDFVEISAFVDILENASQEEHDAVFEATDGYQNDPDYAREVIRNLSQNIIGVR